MVETGSTATGRLVIEGQAPFRITAIRSTAPRFQFPTIADAKTVVWNGPMGVFEIPQFATGTLEVAKAISHIDGLSVVGGGDSAAAVRQLDLESGFGHISTGGGASLEFMAGRKLPGVEVLSDA